MKTKSNEHIECEKWFAAKNRRREWIKKHGWKFFGYPVFVVWIALGVIATVCVLGFVLIHAAIFLDKNNGTIEKALGITSLHDELRGEIETQRQTIAALNDAAVNNNRAIGTLRAYIDLRDDLSMEQRGEIAALQDRVDKLNAQLNPPLTNGIIFITNAAPILWITNAPCTIINPTTNVRPIWNRR